MVHIEMAATVESFGSTETLDLWTRFQELGRREMSPVIRINEKKPLNFQSTMLTDLFAWC